MSNQNFTPTDSTDPETNREPKQLVLPAPLGAKIERRVTNTEFDSAEAYVSFVLEAVLRELDEQTETEIAQQDTEPTDTESVEERLESLGYL